MRTLVAIALLYSAQAFACPQLKGNYICTKSDGTSEPLVVTQELKKGVEIYDYNGSNITADNTAYPVPDDANLKSGTFRAWCEDDLNLKAQLIGKYWNNGTYFGDLTLNMNFALMGTDIKQMAQGEVVNKGGKYPINSDMTCARQ